MSEKTDTIAAVATPQGRGGIAIIRISGELSLKICKKICGIIPRPRFAEYAGFKSANGDLIDRGIVVFFQNPASYTGEDVVECHIHGGAFVGQQLLDEIFSLGARPARPGEFTERAYLNNKLDLVQAEAVADLIDSQSKRAAISAMQSLDGVFSSQVEELREQVFRARALIEAALDFPDEEDVNVDMSPAVEAIQKSQELLGLLLSRAESGRVLGQCPCIVIVGRPNVGKSSIINYMSANDTAIVSEIPGTTRDMLREKVLLDGNVFVLIDTAGLRESGDDIEQEGVRRAYQALARADLVLNVCEANKNENEESALVEDHITNGAAVIKVINKVDLFPENQFNNTNEKVYVSAKSGKGMDVLISRICNSFDTDQDQEENLIYARQRHIDAIRSIQRALKETEEAVQTGQGAELIAENLRLALLGFDQITGKTVADDVLGEIFSSFCIGK